MCWEVGWGVQNWRCGVWGGGNVRYSFKTIVPSKVTHLIHSPIGEQSSLAFCLEPQKHRGHQRSPRHPVFFCAHAPAHTVTGTHAHARTRAQPPCGMEHGTERWRQERGKVPTCSPFSLSASRSHLPAAGPNSAPSSVKVRKWAGFLSQSGKSTLL